MLGVGWLGRRLAYILAISGASAAARRPGDVYLGAPVASTIVIFVILVSTTIYQTAR